MEVIFYSLRCADLVNFLFGVCRSVFERHSSCKHSKSKYNMSGKIVLGLLVFCAYVICSSETTVLDRLKITDEKIDQPFSQSSTSNLSENKHRSKRSAASGSINFKFGKMVAAFMSYTSMRIRNLLIEPSDATVTENNTPEEKVTRRKPSMESFLKYERDNEVKLVYRGMDCKLRHFGCKENSCWANCGPRISSDDWCFVTKNDTVGADDIKQVACKRDSDCSPCLPCAGSCMMVGVKINAKGQIENL